MVVHLADERIMPEGFGAGISFYAKQILLICLQRKMPAVGQK